MYDLALYLARFEPPHSGHLTEIRLALSKANKVAILIGSAHRPRSPKYPWTTTEREAMISACLSAEERARIVFVPLEDNLYDDAAWAKDLREKVKVQSSETSRICMVGSGPATTHTSRLFPEWTFVDSEAQARPPSAELRHQLLTEGGSALDYSQAFPSSMKDLLQKWVQGPEFNQVAGEYRSILDYRKKWAAAPYEVNFVTADALVIKSDHILLVERKRNPGKGLWALPGGFLNTDERILDAALRELDEETALDVPREELLAALAEREVFDLPDRSLRGRTITHCFCFRLGPGPLPKVTPQDDAARAFWLPIREVLSAGDRFFEDHRDIILHFTKIDH